MVTINGFMVVRKPDQNFDLAYPKPAPRLASIYYSGVDRMPWFDLDEDFYNHSLPEDINDLRDQLVKGNADLSGLKTVNSFETASRLLAYNNRNGPQNEIVAIHSEKLIQHKGVFQLHAPEFEDLGYDVIVLGEWSLIEAGIFTVPEVFPTWTPKLNKSGLLSKLEDVEEYTSAYIKAMKKEQVEPTALPTRDSIVPIKVYSFNQHKIDAAAQIC